jgi:hypothetical protein
VFVEDASALVAVDPLLDASVHPSALHTKFHVLACEALLLPAICVDAPVTVIVPSAVAPDGIEPSVVELESAA